MLPNDDVEILQQQIDATAELIKQAAEIKETDTTEKEGQNETARKV